MVKMMKCCIGTETQALTKKKELLCVVVKENLLSKVEVD